MAEPEQRPEQKPSEKRGLVQAMRYAHLGMVLPAAVFVGWLLGAWADRSFGTGWMTITGILLGIVAGFLEITRASLRMMREK